MRTTAVLGLLLPLAAAVSYDGYKAFHIDSHDDFDAVESALADLGYVSLDCESNHKTFDVAISPENLEAFHALGLDAKIVAEDVGAELAAATGEMKPYSASRKFAGRADLPDIGYFDSYHTFEEHLQFLEDVQAAFPDNSEIFTAGDSLEGRPIQGIHVWGSGGPSTHPAIIWQANVHAREWITGVTVEYMLYKLIQGYQNGDAVPLSTLNNFDFYVMPIVNPDGFVYTNTDRLWRKNRQSRQGASCRGTDLNRNWPHQWNIDGGASTNPCSDSYRGEAPGDSPEMAVLSNWTATIGQTTGIKLFVDWHAYSQLILLPYSYSCTAEAETIEEQMDLAGGVASAIRGVNGLNFVYGPTCQVIYQASGSSLDFAFDVAGAELSWAFELRPGSNAGNGFVIPPSNIVPSGEENWAGMEYLFSTF